MTSSGIAKSAFSYGIASAKSVAAFVLSEAKPVFLLLGNNSTSPQDVVIVRLMAKKDHRELQIGKANATPA